MYQRNATLGGPTEAHRRRRHPAGNEAENAIFAAG
jgi:hypothetical protein